MGGPKNVPNMNEIQDTLQPVNSDCDWVGGGGGQGGNKQTDGQTDPNTQDNTLQLKKAKGKK